MGPMTQASPVTITIFLAFPLKLPNTMGPSKTTNGEAGSPSLPGPQLPQGAATPQAFPSSLVLATVKFPFGWLCLRAVMVSYHSRSLKQWRLILLLLEARSPNTGACKPMSSLWLQNTVLNPRVCSTLLFVFVLSRPLLHFFHS